MGLIVKCANCFCHVNYEPYGQSWVVGVTHLRSRRGNSIFVVRGFERQKDAEIAMKVLIDTGIDWDNITIDELRTLRDEYAGKGLHKFVCEHLQW